MHMHINVHIRIRMHIHRNVHEHVHVYVKVLINIFNYEDKDKHTYTCAAAKTKTKPKTQTSQGYRLGDGLFGSSTRVVTPRESKDDSPEPWLQHPEKDAVNMSAVSSQVSQHTDLGTSKPQKANKNTQKHTPKHTSNIQPILMCLCYTCNGYAQ